HLDLAAYESFMKGGKRGAPVVPGKSASSLVIKLAGKTRKPFMPPKSEEPLTPSELALLKLWIDQGARASNFQLRTSVGTRSSKLEALSSGPNRFPSKSGVVLSALPESVHPVRALAFSPENRTLAIARANRLFIYDADKGNLIRNLSDPA